MKEFLWVPFVVSLLAVASWYQKLVNFEQQVIDSTLQKVEVVVEQELDEIEAKLNAFFAEAELSVDSIAANLSDPEPDYTGLIPSMLALLEQPQCTAIATHFAEAFEPQTLAKYFPEYTYEDEFKTLYAPFFTKSGRTETSFPYDYTLTGPNARNTGWYSEAIEEGSWFGPYFGAANKKFLISYRSPFRWNDVLQANLGNVVADYSLENLRDFMADLQLLDSGYGIIITTDGTIISHPVKEYLARNIREVEELDLTIGRINKFEQGRFHLLSSASQQVSKNHRQNLLYTRDFSDRGWKILAVLNKDDTLVIQTDEEPRPYQAVLHKMRVTFVLLCAACLFFFSVPLIVRLQHKGWYLVACFSVLCLSSIVLIWYNHLQAERNDNADKIVVTNKTELEAALNSFEREQKLAGTQASDKIKINTGFFIQSVKFASANDIFVTGFAWQKLPAEWLHLLEPDDTSARLLEFVLPEAESSSVEVVYSDRDITRWYFEASLRQSFNYSKYPFDDEDIWIRTRFTEFYHNDVILVPDFDAYPSFAGADRNGLESDIFIEGWNINNTYYYFRNVDYSSNFGAPGDVRTLNNKPDLFFNISIRREFLGVFIAYMIPLGVIAYLLFAVLLTRTRDTEGNELYGFKAANVLGYAGSLFFVLIVSHMSLRETLQAKGIIYLEYFFFILYITIASAAASAIPFFNKKSNQGSKGKWAVLLYWPLLLLSILIITTLRFS